MMPKAAPTRMNTKKVAPVKKTAVAKKTDAEPKDKGGRVAEFDNDFVHLIAREVYTIGLLENSMGRPITQITPAGLDSNCQICKASVRTVLKVLLQHGFLKKENLRVPAGTPVLATDTGTKGVPRWIQEKYERKKDEE